jgi:hypothetical protein
VTVLPSHKYGDPLQVLINKENAIENRVRNCQGCANLSFDASGDRIIANCFKGYKAGRKDVSKCHSERLKQDCKGAK